MKTKTIHVDTYELTDTGLNIQDRETKSIRTMGDIPIYVLYAVLKYIQIAVSGVKAKNKTKAECKARLFYVQYF